MSNTNTDILVAGAVAAFTIDLLIYPLDTIKTRYQSQDYLKTYASSASIKQAPPHVFRGLYQGVGSVIVATLPAAAIFFTTYEATKTFYSNLFAKLNPHLPGGLTIPTPVVYSLASGTAELASCLVLTPAEVIKQNAQMLRSAPSSAGGRHGGWTNSTSIRALRMISQSGGSQGASIAAHRLLTGYTALVARNLPFTALQFPIFEAARRRIWEWRDTRASTGVAGTSRDGSGGVGGGERRVEQGSVTRGLLETGWVNGVSAAMSGSIAATVTTPTDVVKTRMMLFSGGHTSKAQAQAETQAQKGGHAPRARHTAEKGAAKQTGTGPGHCDTKGQPANAAARQNLSGMQVARLVYQERGIRGLFRGGLLRAGWTALGSGLYLGSYEVAKVWLKGTNDGDDDDDGI